MMRPERLRDSGEILMQQKIPRLVAAIAAALAFTLPCATCAEEVSQTIS
jgi:hypothetical protein